MKSRVIQSEPAQPISSNTHPVAGSGSTVDTRSRGGRVSALLRRHPLISFFVIAFALTWVTVPIGTFMAAGPLIAALVMTGAVAGKPGMRELGRRMISWRVGWQWYAAALLVPLAVAFSAGGLTTAFGGQGRAFSQLSLSALALLFAMRMVVPVFAPLGEEPGWRGFALPRLQNGGSPFRATLILGVVVAVWHAPLMFIAEENFQPVLLIATVAVTFFYTWLFNHTRGSVFMTMIAHAAEGLVGATLVDDGGFTGANEGRFALWYTVGWSVVAIVLLMADRKMWRTQQTGALIVVDSATQRRRDAASPSRHLAPAAAATAAVVLLLVGSASVASATSQPGKARYIARADAICSATMKATDKVVEDLGYEGGEAVTRIVALARDEVAELRGLTPPKGDTTKVTKIYDAVTAGFDQIEAHPSVIDDEPGPLAKATTLAKAYGLEVCGRG